MSNSQGYNKKLLEYKPALTTARVNPRPSVSPKKMPKAERKRINKKAPPEGYDDISDTLLEFQQKLKDATVASHEGKKRNETLWPMFQIRHQCTRWIWDLYKREAISQELYQYLITKEKAVDKDLVAKWKKPGYENLCCTQCIQTKETNFNSTCICRVPKKEMKEGQLVECTKCGCRGCASGD